MTRDLLRHRSAVLGAVAILAALSLVGVLWMVRSRAAQPEPSIAVLPFVNLSGDPQNDYFSDGLTEEVIYRLSAIPGLKVISRTSAMYYKESGKSLRQIANELGVAHILEGSVRQGDGSLRISAQLFDVGADEHLWAENYNYEQRDIFTVQEEMAREVAQALALELGERTQRLLAKRGTADPEAYEFYRRGRFVWNLRTREGHEQAVEYFERAIARDSTYADAYGGLADVYLTDYQLNLSGRSEAEAFSLLNAAAKRALALDDESADAHVSAAVALWWQRNWKGAEGELRRAIDLNPNHATARSWYSLLLRGMRRSAEALEESRRAAELDPFAVVASYNYGWQCYLDRNYDCAIEQYGNSIEIGEYPSSYRGLGLIYAQKGMAEESIGAVRKAVELAPQRTDLLADLAYVQAVSGNRDDAREILGRAKERPWEGFNIARAHVALGEPDSAFAWLGRSNWKWPHRAVPSDPALDPLRSDPRFAQLVARVAREMGME